jgi:hypothetical protein
MQDKEVTVVVRVTNKSYFKEKIRQNVVRMLVYTVFGGTINKISIKNLYNL